MSWWKRDKNELQKQRETQLDTEPSVLSSDKGSTSNNMDHMLAALDGAQTALMMVDRDFTITYVNKKSLSLLQEHERLFRTMWPSFSADKEAVVGTCIDLFHKDPQHQRRLLSDPGNLPYETTINVGGVSLKLNIGAIIDARGNYVGNTLEWDDVTVELAKENDVTRLQSAIDQAQTALVMVDRDLNITYANQQTIKLFKECEAEFRTVWPGFTATEEWLSGRCIDEFHKNPAHQRQLLSDPNNLPYTTDINIGSIQIELNVAAILSASGEYIGSTLEWQNVTEERAKANDVARLQSAVDQAQTALVMVDRDLNITYANQQTIKLFKECEAEFRTVWPGFTATEEWLAGRCIDEFHKNPAHQRKLLSDPDNLPYKTDITIGAVQIELNVAAIINAQGEYVGSTLEWQNVTEERAKENDVARLQSAVDQAQTAMVMVDRDLNITYANKQTIALFKECQTEFRKVWPGFTATEEWLSGRCIDEFHKNPAHQRQLLSDPNNLPYSTDIKIGNILIELNVAAIKIGRAHV